MRYGLVCLDAGFTLLSPRRTLADSLRGVLAEHGFSATDDELRRAWQAADTWFWDEYHRPGNDTWTRDDAIEATWRRFHDLMLAELGVRGRRQLVDRVLAAQFSPDTWELYPDVITTLAELRGASSGEPPAICVVSDWGSSLPSILDGLGLGPHLDFVLASGAVGYAKPDPAFFRIALARAGVAPGDAVMIGDSYQADVLGAQAAGMDGILLRRPDGGAGSSAEERLMTSTAPVPREATVPVIASLAELPAIVRGEATPAPGHARVER